MLVLVERMEEQNRATIEAVQAQGTSLSREMADMRRDFVTRFEVIEAAIRQNSADIRKNSADVRKHSAGIREQAEELRRVKAQLEDLTVLVREKPDTAAYHKLDVRLSELERRAGI